MKDLKIPEKRYRPEIEGLRTFATLLVVIYHIWLGRVSGGIDVFFILSGFLITTSLITKLEKHGTVAYSHYLLGLVKRLFPQALIVSTVICIASLFILPKVQWEALKSHIVASVLYFENWRLAFDAVDYLERDNATSPFQHFWSLSVQGQFYVVWPFIIVLAFGLAKYTFKLPVRKTLLAVLSFMIVVSLSYSIYKTYTDQAWAYFDTFARVWEFSIGGVFAILLPYLIFNKYVSTFLGWIGLVIICTTGLVLPVSTVFPGYLALVPITGAILILVAAQNSTKLGVDKMLAWKPLTSIGGLSYGIYLWHWPLLIFYQIQFDVQTVPIVDGLVLIIITMVLAYISTRFVEKPIRSLDNNKHKIPLYASLVILFLTVFASAIVFAQFVKAEKQKINETPITAEYYPGAAALYNNAEVKDVGMFIPSLLDIKMDVPDFYSLHHCLAQGKEEVRLCQFGAKENPDYTVAVVGGSHAGHWMPALEILAEEMNFRIDLYSHDGCRFTTADKKFKFKEVCLKWNENMIEVLKQSPPDLVFVPSTLNKRQEIPQGFINQWKALDGYTHIFGIRDNPRMKENIPACIERVRYVTKCSVARDEALSKVAPWEYTKDIPDNVYFADLSDNFCDEERCHGVIGNIVVYRDNNHITSTYMRTLAPALKAPLQEAFDLLDSGQFEQHRGG